MEAVADWYHAWFSGIVLRAAGLPEARLELFVGCPGRHDRFASLALQAEPDRPKEWRLKLH